MGEGCFAWSQKKMPKENIVQNTRNLNRQHFYKVKQTSGKLKYERNDMDHDIWTIQIQMWDQIQAISLFFVLNGTSGRKKWMRVGITPSLKVMNMFGFFGCNMKIKIAKETTFRMEEVLNYGKKILIKFQHINPCPYRNTSIECETDTIINGSWNENVYSFVMDSG